MASKDCDALLDTARINVRNAVKQGEDSLLRTIGAVFFADGLRTELHIFSEGILHLSDLHAYTSNSIQFVKYMNEKGDFIPASTY